MSLSYLVGWTQYGPKKYCKYHHDLHFDRGFYHYIEWYLQKTKTSVGSVTKNSFSRSCHQDGILIRLTGTTAEAILRIIHKNKPGANVVYSNAISIFIIYIQQQCLHISEFNLNTSFIANLTSLLKCYIINSVISTKEKYIQIIITGNFNSRVKVSEDSYDCCFYCNFAHIVTTALPIFLFCCLLLWIFRHHRIYGIQ